MTGTPPSGLTRSEALRLFSDTLRLTGVAHTGPETQGDPRLVGKRVGLLNGSSWITLWANYFGRMYLPGVHLINMGNEAVQIHFMEAHAAGADLPRANLAAFKRYAADLVKLGHVDAVLITCSTMNRAYPHVQAVLQPYGVPVFQIDRPMMEQAVEQGGRILVLATHGPTVKSTQALLSEVAAERKRPIEMDGALVDAAWTALARGEVEQHNHILAETIRARTREDKFSCVVLAQLSMSVFLLSYPNYVQEFGVPILTSGQCGFQAVRDALIAMKNSHST